MGMREAGGKIESEEEIGNRTGMKFVAEQMRAYRQTSKAMQQDLSRVATVLTLLSITSYADIRSVATKSSVLSSISKISRTLPDAIFFKPYCSRSTAVTADDDAMVVLQAESREQCC